MAGRRERFPICGSDTPMSLMQEEAQAQDKALLPDGASCHNNRETVNGFDQEDQTQEAISPSSTRLRRSGYIPFLVFIYIGFALFSWIVTCYLSFHPIPTNAYGVVSNTEHDLTTGGRSLHHLYAENERWYHTARIIQSIVSVLTIPLTSAACSSAAVIFIQQRQRQPRDGLSIRQLMTLADKGWTDLSTYSQILPFFNTGKWRRYGSSFLLLAMSVNILGSIISPLQQIFLSSKNIKTPTSPTSLWRIFDIPDMVNRYRYLKDEQDDNSIVVLTRGTLASTLRTQQPSHMWQGSSASCTTDAGLTDAIYCHGGGVTLANISALSDPFWAPLPANFSTGLIRQFAPRINSSVQFQDISADEFPQRCDKIDGAFYVDYFYAEEAPAMDMGYGIQACMPENVTETPWKSTRKRQDFSEKLYLNITLIDAPGHTKTSYYNVTLGTTAGYFELPNYMNGETAGPILDIDPKDVEDEAIYDQDFEPIRKRETIVAHANSIEESSALKEVVSKGPLLTIAMALFGHGSFIQTIQAQSNASIGSESTGGSSLEEFCVYLTPLGSFLPRSNSDVGDGICSYLDGDSTFLAVKSWLQRLTWSAEESREAFNAAAFLANQVLMDASSGSLIISMDKGADSQIPDLSSAGLILISVLLGLHLSVLIMLAVYSSRTPRWTNQLNSFAMMRIGASVADRVPLLVGQKTDKIKALDEMPGWIGDSSTKDDRVGRLALGGPVMLSTRINRRFECYEGDNDKREHGFTVWEKDVPVAPYHR